MTLDQACKVVNEHRGDSVVVTTMGSMNSTDKLEHSPLTVACVPLMGGAASLGLGIALARPERNTIILDGDASLLMELGGLVSVAETAPRNFFHILMNNRVQFAGLGNLETPGSIKVDFAGLAQASGYQAVYHFDSSEAFAEQLPKILQGPAPAFIDLAISYDPAVLGSEKPAVEMTDSRFTRMGDELRRIHDLLELAD